MLNYNDYDPSEVYSYTDNGTKCVGRIFDKASSKGRVVLGEKHYTIKVKEISMDVVPDLPLENKLVPDLILTTYKGIVSGRPNSEVFLRPHGRNNFTGEIKLKNSTYIIEIRENEMKYREE